jgi:hypothetical protein
MATPTGLSGAPDSGEEGLARAHPMQGGVRERRVELALKTQILSRHQPRIEAARSGSGDNVRGRVDADDDRTRRNDLFGRYPVAAAEIENALAR